MQRRQFIQTAVALPVLLTARLAPAWAATSARCRARVRPTDAAWPAEARWEELDKRVGGNLIKVQSPLSVCRTAPGEEDCKAVLAQLPNPYFIGDQLGLTQTSGWVDAWRSTPSVYAVAARNASDVSAAIDFARTHHLRLVVRGGGHSYQGTSDSADSLLIWTRHMNAITLHDGFVASGCAGHHAPQPAVTVEAGAMWLDVYNAVTTIGNRYVQGGGCATVGVAGLVQSGGFGSFSKLYGTAAAALLEAEIVTADGVVRIANACTNPDLFWGLKGGGGGSLGVVTKVTLRTRELPDFFGGAGARIKAHSASAFHTLIARFISFYADNLLNPHWGESIKIQSDDTLEISMVSQGLDSQQARDVWKSFMEWVAAASEQYTFVDKPSIGSTAARNWWDVAYRRIHAPDSMVADSRQGASPNHAWWDGDGAQVGVFLHGFHSAWLPAALLDATSQQRLVDALFDASRQWEVQLHFNKGLAGAPAAEIKAASHTATNPAVLDAFALAIIAGGAPPAFADLPGPGPDLPTARKHAASIDKAMDELRKVAPDAGSYVSESDYFEKSWQRAFWGSHYPRLAAVKEKYDPDGLFFVHHGVGSEHWSDDGFTPVG